MCKLDFIRFQRVKDIFLKLFFVFKNSFDSESKSWSPLRYHRVLYQINFFHQIFMVIWFCRTKLLQNCILKQFMWMDHVFWQVSTFLEDFLAFNQYVVFTTNLFMESFRNLISSFFLTILAFWMNEVCNVDMAFGQNMPYSFK